LVVPPRPQAELADPVRNLINAAMASGDQQAVNAILKFARQTNPDAKPQIDALDAEFTAQQAEKVARAARERADRLANATFLSNWKGEIEVGATYTTGNTDSIALYAGTSLTREGLRWRHQIVGRVDFQETNHVTTADHGSIFWQSNYKVDDRLFFFGLTQYERDRFLGYDNRYTVGTGVGYTVVSTPEVKLNLQGGPAMRYTQRVDEPDRTTGAGRASIDMSWKVTPTLSFAETAAFYLESGDTNATSTTSLDTRLIGALKARLSYNVQYERNAPDGRQPIDTTSRATLVYGF
jgi:putative salt-induced outer membrane protein